MKYRYSLAKKWVDKIADFGEFAHGATQVSIKTRDGKIYHGVLVSNCKHIVAIRGYDDLPFVIEDIDDIFQTEDDVNPKERGGWKFWDNWQHK